MSILLTLVSRSYCHICDEMERELNLMAEASGFEIEVIDVDADPKLVALYDELVPVLLHEGQALCHYFLETAKVRDYLSKIS